MPGCRETRVHTHGTGGVYAPEDVMSIFEGQPKVWLCSLGSSHCECRAALERLTRERDEARTSCEQLHDQAEIWKAEADTLRALLRSVEYLAHEDCVDASCHACGDWNPQCVVCGRCKSCGHAPDCRLKAALEE